MISRYFQNKKGLFVVLLNKEFDDLKECLQLPKDEMVNGFVDGFIDSMDLKDEITFTRMLVMNGSDPEVGSLVRDKLQEASEILSKSLKKEYRTILKLRYFDDLSLKQIEETLDESSSTVRVKLFRAKKMLANKLDRA